MPTINRQRWTEEETESLLYMLDKGLESSVIARILGRSESSISGKIYQLRLKGHAPVQMSIEEVEAVDTKPEPKPEKTIRSKKRKVYVLTRYAQPSWLERLRCYLNGTKWESVDDLPRH